MILENILQLILVTLIPALELRASIPYGIFVLGLDWQLVAAVCIITNIILGPVIYFALDKFVHIVTRVNFINRTWLFFVERTHKRNIQRYVDKYGLIGVALFVAIPLPGSGSYTGALAAYLLGLGYKRFIIANIIGVIIAGALITAASLGLLSFI